MDKYTLADRSSGDIFSIRVNDGQLELSQDVGTALAEPILKDTLNSTRWKLFVDNFRIGIETVVSTDETTLNLEDITTGHTFKVEIEQGQIKITESFDPVFEVSTILKKRHYAGEIGTTFIIDTQVDILAASVVQINVKRPDGENAVWAGVVYQTNKIKHVMAEGDIDISGKYKLQAYVETADAKLYGETVEIYIYDQYE